MKFNPEKTDRSLKLLIIMFFITTFLSAIILKLFHFSGRGWLYCFFLWVPPIYHLIFGSQKSWDIFMRAFHFKRNITLFIVMFMGGLPIILRLVLEHKIFGIHVWINNVIVLPFLIWTVMGYLQRMEDKTKFFTDFFRERASYFVLLNSFIVQLCMMYIFFYINTLIRVQIAPLSSIANSVFQFFTLVAIILSMGMIVLFSVMYRKQDLPFTFTFPVSTFNLLCLFLVVWGMMVFYNRENKIEIYFYLWIMVYVLLFFITMFEQLKDYSTRKVLALLNENNMMLLIAVPIMLLAYGGIVYVLYASMDTLAESSNISLSIAGLVVIAVLSMMLLISDDLYRILTRYGENKRKKNSEESGYRIFLTSTMGGSDLIDGIRIPKPFQKQNDFMKNLKKAIGEKAVSCLMISSDPADYERNDAFRNLLKQSFLLSEIDLKEILFCDDRNCENLESYMKEFNMIILAGGHVPTQNEFFQRIELEKHIVQYPGILVGISAGSMNSCKEVYAQPELDGEAVDPNYNRYLKGLGIVEFALLPHFQYLKEQWLDGLSIYHNICIPDSYTLPYFAMEDGAYIAIDEKNGIDFFGKIWYLSNGTETLVCKEDNSCSYEMIREVIGDL